MHYLLLVHQKVVGLLIVILMIKLMENMLKLVLVISFPLISQKILIFLIPMLKHSNNNLKSSKNLPLKVKSCNGDHSISLIKIFLNSQVMINPKFILLIILFNLKNILQFLQEFMITSIFQCNFIIHFYYYSYFYFLSFILLIYHFSKHDIE